MNEAYINIMEQEKQLQLHITKNDRKIITDFANSLSDKEYQLRCMWAIQILESGIAGESAARGCCAVNTPYQKRREYLFEVAPQRVYDQLR